MTGVNGILFEDLRIFEIISHSVLKIRNVSVNVVEKIKTRILRLISSPPRKSSRLWGNAVKCYRVRQVTDSSIMRRRKYATCMPDNSNMNPDTLSCHVAFPRKNCYVKAPQSYVICTLPVLFLSVSLLVLLLTPWSRVLLEKLTGFQLVKKFPAFYGTRRFITAFTSARYLSLSWASSIQSMPLRPTSWRSILILSSHLCLGLPSGLFPSGFPTKTLYTPLLSPHTRYMPSPSHFSRFYHPKNIGWGVQIIQLLIM